MNTLLANIGTVAGIIGILVCLIAGLARLGGFYYLAGFESMTLLNTGVALMVLAILMKVELIYRKSNSAP
ncbi:hypothetical protein [Sedimenticola hydrogenitrophicus]|uniref:hypothetical protein n=1 Tax=Sedimenticola hydrogenitrophicus TaxID=2967975 RepID=UPI0023B0390A|nr:hypothetical protein [Sedimenticola hydrogenitrophicus]